MIWEFIQNQSLGMKWLKDLIGSLLSVAGLDINGKVGGSVQFFIYDVIKIAVLLCSLIFMINYIQSFFPPERTKKIFKIGDKIKIKVLSANKMTRRIDFELGE